MSERIIGANIDGKGFFGKAVGWVEDAALAGFEVEKLKTRATHVAEEGMAETKRLLKKGEHAAEDLIEDTAHKIKHDPWRSVGISLGVGFGLGILTGLLLTYQTKKCDQ